MEMTKVNTPTAEAKKNGIFAVASLHIWEELKPLADFADRERALLQGYILGLEKVPKDFPMDTVVKLAERAVEYTQLVDDARYTTFEIVEALLQPQNIEHLDTVLAADDKTFCLMVQAACRETRAWHDEDYWHGKSQKYEEETAKNFIELVKGMEQEAPAPTSAGIQQVGALRPTSKATFEEVGIKINACLEDLRDTLCRKKALVYNFAILEALIARRSIAPGLLTKLADRVVTSWYETDDGRYTEFDIVRALFQDGYFEHLDTVLAAGDNQFLEMAVAACDEVRAMCEDSALRVRPFIELVKIEEAAQKERESYLTVDAVRKLPVGSAVTIVDADGEHIRSMVLAPTDNERLHLVRPDPKDSTAPLCFSMLYRGYGPDGWNAFL